jgi:iron complex transport system substrate-binding protein
MMLALIAGITAGQSFPLTYTSCGIEHTLTQTPSRIVTMNQGVTELMLAMGLADRMVGTAYMDDEIWPRYASDYNRIPVLLSAYPTEDQIMAVTPDFIMGSYSSAFREKTCATTCRGIFSNQTGIAPCEGSGSEWFEATSNTTIAVATCRPQLHSAGIGTWLEPVSCENNDLRPQGGATEETVYAAIRQIGEIFNVRLVANQLISEIERLLHC